MREKTEFTVDEAKCVGCGKCVNVCSGMVLSMRNGHPVMKQFERFGWRGCWRCLHCLAVCPEGAISIFGKRAEDSLLPPPREMGEYMERLVVNRRSCRQFLDRNVEPKVITRILSTMAAVPTGGNAQGVEYTVIDDKDRVHSIWETAYSKMEADANRHVYTHSFSDFYYSKMKESENSVRKGDLFQAPINPLWSKWLIHTVPRPTLAASSIICVAAMVASVEPLLWPFCGWVQQTVLSQQTKNTKRAP